jgi:hypothetical protein
MKRTMFVAAFIMTACIMAFDVHADLADGLAAYFPFSGNANDESGNGNHGTVYNATLTADRFGKPSKAYDFDGDGDYIDCGNDASLEITGSLTLSGWIKPSTLPQSGTIIYKPGGYQVDVYNSALRFALNGSVKANNSLSGLSGTWIFFAATFDATMTTNNIKLYVNEESPIVGSFDGAIGTNTAPLLLGIYRTSGTTFTFNGAIDEVRIYNRPLSAGEVKNLYNYGKARVVPYVTPLILD